MSTHKFSIFSSSAGSGKTYTLTREYLKIALAHENPHYFRYILAITFTNDAANEMKARIIQALRAFAFPQNLDRAEAASYQGLQEDLAQTLKISPQTLSERAAKTFIRMMYQYGDFAVSTIDSFVNRVMSAFTRELELPYNYEVDLDTDQLLKTAIDRVLEKVGHQASGRLSNFLESWVKQKEEEGKNWSIIAQDLAMFSRQLLNEKSYAFLEPLRKLGLEHYQAIQTHWQSYLQDLETEIQGIAQTAVDYIQEKGLHASFKGGKTRSVETYFVKNTQDLDLKTRAIDKNYMREALEKDIWGKGKNEDLLAPHTAQLKTWIEAIENRKDQERSTFLLIKSILPQLYQLALIGEIESELAQVKAENQSIHISDSNKKIAEIIHHEPVPFIYERVGERYKHILIDEFQDTSRLQWENLLPLIENNLAENTFNLIVGDAKQAIYRWRGGEMEQLVFLYHKEFAQLQALHQNESPFLGDRYGTLEMHHEGNQLEYNYRSYAEIIDFNNAFFHHIRESDLGIRFPLFSLIYEGASQKIPEGRKKTGGFVGLSFISGAEDYHALTLEKLLARIHALLEEGYAPSDIAIISRNNRQGKEIAAFLQANQLEVLSQTSLLLVSDEKVRFVISLLKVIHRPDDRLARSEALYLFYQVVFQRSPSAEENQKIVSVVEDSVMAFYACFEEAGYILPLGQLFAQNLYDTSDRLIRIFNLIARHEQAQYLFRFLDVILEFSRQKNNTLADFLEYWEKKKNVLSINSPPGQEAIRVTTIHKSKGLEFPVVLLPFADWGLYPRPNDTFWASLDIPASYYPDKTPSLPSALLPFSQALEHTSAVDAYQEEMEKTFIENINLLYVAFTRAAQRLYIFSKATDFSKEGQQKGVNFLLFRYLQDLSLWEEGKDYYALYTQTAAPPPKLKPEEESETAYWVDALEPKEQEV